MSFSSYNLEITNTLLNNFKKNVIIKLYDKKTYKCYLY